MLAFSILIFFFYFFLPTFFARYLLTFSCLFLYALLIYCFPFPLFLYSTSAHLARHLLHPF